MASCPDTGDESHGMTRRPERKGETYSRKVENYITDETQRQRRLLYDAPNVGNPDLVPAPCTPINNLRDKVQAKPHLSTQTDSWLGIELCYKEEFIEVDGDVRSLVDMDYFPVNTKVLPSHDNSLPMDASDLDFETLAADSKKDCNTSATKCSKCGSDWLTPVEDLDPELSIHQCLNCGNCMGEDDTMLPRYLRDQLKHGKVKAQFSCCGNDDLDEFVLIMDEKSNTLMVHCNKCGKNVRTDGEDTGEVDDEDLKDWETDFETDMKDMRQYIECDCRRGKMGIEVSCNRKGRLETIACKNCKFSKRMNEAQGSDYIHKRDIQNFGDIQIGDHICWDRPSGYSHHAIVIEKPSHHGMCRVCHYNGPSPNGFGKTKGMIIKEDLDLNKQEGQLYRLEYKKCSSTKKVLERATSRLYETKYNLIGNNCETFAHWCKTGWSSSAQVNAVAKSVKGAASTVMSLLRKSITGKTSSSGLSNGAQVTTAVSIAIVAGAKVLHTAKAVSRAHSQHQQGLLSDSPYLEVVVKQLVQGAGAIVGAVVGGVIGTLYIPVVGTVLGVTLGSLIGEFLGHMIGARVAPLVASKQYADQWKY